MISQGIAGWIDWLFALFGQALLVFALICVIMAVSFAHGWLYQHSPLLRRVYGKVLRLG